MHIFRHNTFFEMNLFIDVEPKSRFLDYIFLCNYYQGFKCEERVYGHSYGVSYVFRTAVIRFPAMNWSGADGHVKRNGQNPCF